MKTFKNGALDFKVDTDQEENYESNMIKTYPNERVEPLKYSIVCNSSVLTKHCI